MNRSVVLLTVCGLAFAAPLFAQSNPIYVQFSPGSVKGALYKPDSGTAPHIAVLLIHRTSNFLAHVATREEAFAGPKAELGPDLVLVSKNGWDMKGAVRTPDLEGVGKLTGMHTQDDAFVLVRGAHTEGEADVQDVAATAVAALGLDASGLDGRVLA